MIPQQNNTQPPQQADNIEVEDGEDFAGNVELSIKMIALNQYSRCCIEGSKEMNRGGMTIKVIRGAEVPVQIPNQRELFINSVKILEIILYPELCHKDRKDVQGKVNGIDDDIEKQEGKSRVIYEDFKLRFSKMGKEGKGQINFSDTVAEINDKKEYIMVGLFRNKLTALSLLLHELKYFDTDKAGG